jgi:hypothetical protein
MIAKENADGSIVKLRRDGIIANAAPRPIKKNGKGICGTWRASKLPMITVANMMPKITT